MKIQIRKVNGVPMARPVNPFYKFKTNVAGDSTWQRDTEWLKFEQSVTEHEAPGFEEGEAEGELRWRAKIFGDKEWKLMPINHEPINAMGVINQQIWIVPTPEKAEVKDNITALCKEIEETALRLTDLGDKLKIAVRKRFESTH